MALQLNQANRGRNFKLAAGAGAVVVGASYLLLSTFPHLKTSLYNYITNNQQTDTSDEDNEPIELTRSRSGLVDDHNDHSDSESSPESSSHALSRSVPDEKSLVDINEWHHDDVKSWLSAKEISPPPGIDRDGLISYAKSIQKKTT